MLFPKDKKGFAKLNPRNQSMGESVMSVLPDILAILSIQAFCSLVKGG